MRNIRLNKKRNRMYYFHYSWDKRYADDDQRISGRLDDTVLDRIDGHQMYYFVKECILEIWDSTNPKAFQIIDRAVKEDVPPSLHSQVEIKKWIVDNGILYLGKLQNAL